MLKSNQSSKRNNGSAAGLKGSCYLLNIYARDEVSCWTSYEKSEVINRMGQACKFIESHALKYGSKLTFIHGNFGLEKDIEYPGIIPTDMFENPQWTEDILAIIGYSNGNSAVKLIKKQFKVQHVAILFHINKPGTSYNLSYSMGIDPVYYAERDVMFYTYQSGISTYPASYAHEILHSFGAGELYFPFDDSDERLVLAREYFPDEVMLRVDNEIDKLMIGEYTAYRVGWLKSLNRKYRIFEDYG